MSTLNHASPKPARDQALDFVKGALVVLMVIYHWCNYFISTDGFGYRYIRFITPSFIFITGFLVSNIYLARYELTDTRLAGRLTLRGIKLLVLFVVLNLAASAVMKRNYDGSELGVGAFLRDAGATFWTGNGSQSVFQVLVPISYMLLLCAGLLLLRRAACFPIYGACGGLSAVVLGVDTLWFQSGNLQLLGAGCLGVFVGGNVWLRIRNVRAGFWPAVGYTAYLLAVTFWNVPYILQILGVCMNLWILYLWGGRGLGGATNRLTLLGQYTLLSYIGQIAILQLLAKGLRPMGDAQLSMIIALPLTLLLTQALVEATQHWRSRWKPVDVTYRTVFN